MNTINRLEETWSPDWDLGLQAEFGFLSETKEEAPDSFMLNDSRPNAWAMAGKEVLNRQATVDRRLACETSSLADVIQFFETLGGLGGDNE